MTDGRQSAYLARLPFYYGWVIVGVAVVTMAIGVNARTAFSLLLPPLLDEFGWDRGLAAGAFSFGFLVSAVISPAVGSLMDRRGPRFVIEIGVLLLAAGLLSATLIQEPWELYLTLGVLVGGGANCISYTAQSLFLPNWFVRYRALALSLAFSGVGVGAILLLPWLQTIIQRDGGVRPAGRWAFSSSACWARSTCFSGDARRMSGCARMAMADPILGPRRQKPTSSTRLGQPLNGRSPVPPAPLDSGGSSPATSVPSSPGMRSRSIRRNISSRWGLV
jgi:MFS family permease